MGEQHHTPEYLAEKRRLTPIVNAGDGYCAERACQHVDRWITPGTPWDLAHDHTDRTGLTFLGPAHRRCNRSEGASRGNRARGRTPRRWFLP